MSFSSEQKADILSQPIKSVCCKRSLLSGIITARGSLSNDGISVSLSSRELAEAICTIIHDVYLADATVSTMSGGGRGYTVLFKSHSATRSLEAFLSGGDFFTEKCRLCHSYFLRGIFLACGRVTDPTKQYMLEFAPKNLIGRFAAFFDELGLSPKLSDKPRETVIYFKNSSSIEDFFALSNMNNTTFALMNAKIQGEIRNNVNRVANCETNNINKAVSASVGQIAVITALVRTGLISRLPDELQKTALLRMEHSDLSLSQLAALITPYISKPGLSHRLKRITEIGEELLQSSKKHT